MACEDEKMACCGEEEYEIVHANIVFFANGADCEVFDCKTGSTSRDLSFKKNFNTSKSYFLLASRPC